MTKKIIIILAFLLFPPIPYLFATDAQSLLKNAVIGAGSGAAASGFSGGDAGKGALIGAGANIAGNVVMDALTGQPAQAPQPTVREKIVYVNQPPAQAVNSVGFTPHKDRRSREYDRGYDKGYTDGYREAMNEIGSYCAEKVVK